MKDLGSVFKIIMVLDLWLVQCYVAQFLGKTLNSILDSASFQLCKCVAYAKVAYFQPLLMAVSDVLHFIILMHTIHHFLFAAVSRASLRGSAGQGPVVQTQQ